MLLPPYGSASPASDRAGRASGPRRASWPRPTRAYSHKSAGQALRTRRVTFTCLERKGRIARRATLGSRGGRPPAFDAERCRQCDAIEGRWVFEGSAAAPLAGRPAPCSGIVAGMPRVAQVGAECLGRLALSATAWAGPAVGTPFSHDGGERGAVVDIAAGVGTSDRSRPWPSRTGWISLVSLPFGRTMALSPGSPCPPHDPTIPV
ncbi:hypothetical protein GCM10022243_58520 [Saccharothrix violaceirubra]